MPTTKVSSEAKSLTGGVSVVERGWQNRHNLVPNELEPDQVRLRLQMASMGNIGPLQMIFKIMETDPRYAGILTALKSSVSLCQFKVFPAEKKSRAANLAYKIVDEQFKRINTTKLVRRLCEPYIYGVRVFEKKWELEGSAHTTNDLVFFKGLKPVPGSRYIMDLDERSPYYGQIKITSDRFPQGKAIDQYVPGALLFADDGDAEEGFYDLAGAARRCLGWWLTKVYTESFWSQFNETFAEPARAAFVPREMKDSERKKIEHFMRFLGRNLYGIFDDDIELEFFNNAHGGTITTYEQLIRMANEEMSYGVTGSAMTSNSNREGSYARDAISFRVRREVVVMLVAMITQYLDEIVQDICRFNIDEDFMAEDRPQARPVVPRAEEKDKLAKMYDTATKLVTVSVRQIREDLEIEEPQDGEETIGPEDRSRLNQLGGSEQSDPATAGEDEDRKPNSAGEQEDD